MWGLTAASASAASLLLNLEGVFTALLARFLFRENFDVRIEIGMFAIATGGAVLAWNTAGVGGVSPGTLLVVAVVVVRVHMVMRNAFVDVPMQVPLGHVHPPRASACSRANRAFTRALSRSASSAPALNAHGSERFRRHPP
jgi:drug/metabolite transporter (DMT)-like permease